MSLPEPVLCIVFGILSPTTSANGYQVGEDDQKTTIRVLVADDHPIAREGIRKLLEMEDDLEVVVGSE